MKYLFINPPAYQYTPAPTTGIPTLLGILSAQHISSEFVDLNIDFINKLLKQDIAEKYIDKIDEEYNDKQNISIANIFVGDFPSWQFYKRNIFLLKQNAKFIYNVFSTEKIYRPMLYKSASVYLRSGLVSYYASFDKQIINSLIPDLEDCRSNCDNPEFSIDINTLVEYVENPLNPLKEYYEDIIENIISPEVKGVSITIGHYFQFLPSMFLCYLLKKKYNIHISIGGSFFNDYYKWITNLPDLFSHFFDSIYIGDNTKSVLDMAEYLEGKRNLSEIENLITCENEKININKTNKTHSVANIPFQEFYGYEKNDYIIPKLYLPIRTSYGCYWHKCIFCMCSNSSVKYAQRPVEKVVDEIEYLSKKYKTNHFYFWDNSIHPKYAEKLADLLIKRKLNIKYSFYARFEEEFDYKLLKKLKKSGCLLIYWGLDAASERILKYINKGIKIDVAKRILKDSSKVKIANIVFVILGHPTETTEDIQKTYDFAKSMKHFVQDINVVAKCLFVDGAILNDKRNYYKQQIITTQQERLNVAGEVQTLFNKFKGVHSVFYMMYLEKFGSDGCDLRFKLGQRLLKSNTSKIKHTFDKILYKIINIKF